MNTGLLTHRTVTSRQRSRSHRSRPAGRVRFRSASSNEAAALHALIAAHTEEGHLLPRSIEELTVRASRFVVALRGGQIIGCAELAPLSHHVAEIRSLVVDRSARAHGIGRSIVGELRRRAERDGFKKLCAFTHDASYFVRRGFSIVPHSSLPEKIAQDCQSCALFRRCGQHAVVLRLGV